MAEQSSDTHAHGIRWNLTDLYTGFDDAALVRDLDEGDRLATAFETRFRGHIAADDLSPARLLEALVAYEEALETGGRPVFYTSLRLAADSQNGEAQKADQRARERWTAARARLLFFPLEIQAIAAERFAVLIEEPTLAAYRSYLEQARRYAPHSLSEPEEKLLSQKSLTGRRAVIQLFDELTGSLRFEVEVGGTVRTLTAGEVMALLRHPDRATRQRASTAFLSTYRSQELVLSSLFNTLLLDHRQDVELRHFGSAIAPRHLDNEVSAPMVEAMMDAVERHHGDIQEFFRLKARLLGLPRLTLADVYAPIAAEAEGIPFADAKALVLESFADFEPRFASLARRFFDEGWIDAEVRPGKRHGAFCASHSPRHHPYVLTSYAGTSRDVSTLAHELGHGVHALLANRQPFLVADAPLVLAETASIFGEMVLVDSLLRRAGSAAAEARILADVLDEIYGTVFRQNALTRFELAAHDARAEGRLSAADLGQIWRRTQSELFGDAVEIPELYDAGWSYIPHFVHSPFYCYAYAFGELLVLALFERYREEGPGFAESVIGLLQRGGSEPPERLLAGLGFDVRKPEFWDIGFRAVRRFASELGARVGQ